MRDDGGGSGARRMRDIGAACADSRVEPCSRARATKAERKLTPCCITRAWAQYLDNNQVHADTVLRPPPPTWICDAEGRSSSIYLDLTSTAMARRSSRGRWAQVCVHLAADLWAMDQSVPVVAEFLAGLMLDGVSNSGRCHVDLQHPALAATSLLTMVSSFRRKLSREGEPRLPMTRLGQRLHQA